MQGKIKQRESFTVYLVLGVPEFEVHSLAHTDLEHIPRVLHLNPRAAAVAHVLVDDLYLPILGQLCTWAESTWPAVGTVDRHGQQNVLFVTLVGCAKRFQTYWSQFFAKFDGFIELLRCLHLEVWRFSCWQQQTTMTKTDKNNCFTPHDRQIKLCQYFLLAYMYKRIHFLFLLAY